MFAHPAKATTIAPAVATAHTDQAGRITIQRTTSGIHLPCPRLQKAKFAASGVPSGRRPHDDERGPEDQGTADECAGTEGLAEDRGPQRDSDEGLDEREGR